MMSIPQFFPKIYSRLLDYIWQLKSAIWKNKFVTFTLVDGSQFDYPLRSAIGRSLFTRRFEVAELAFVRLALKPGDIFFDIGANGGIFTVIAARRVGPGGHVYAFEPGLRELELLYRNIKKNNLANVTVVERAVSNASGKSQFAVSRDGAMNSLSRTNHPGQEIQGWRIVETVSLDDFVDEFYIQKVDFIKIDVEGAEKLVFEGASRLLLPGCRVTILFESSELNASGFGYSVREFLSSMSKTGLSVYYLDQDCSLLPILMQDIRLGREIYNFVATVTENDVS